MKYAIALIENALEERMRLKRTASKLVNDKDSTELQRSFFRTRYVNHEQEVKDLERALALLTEKQGESH